MCVFDVFKGLSNATVLSGRINTGVVQVGEPAWVFPSRGTCLVKHITVNGARVPWAVAGQTVDVAVGGLDDNAVAVGSLLSSRGREIPCVKRVRGQVQVFEPAVPITKGFPVMFHTQQLARPATVRKLNAVLKRGTGEVVKKSPRCITNNMSAIIEIKFDGPICVEQFADCKALGRFMLRYGGETIAAGVITDLL